MIKTITNLTIRKWHDIGTNEVIAESLIIEYIDEHGKTNKTGCITQAGELEYWDADSDEWEDILNAWNENRPSWNQYDDKEQDWQLLSQYLRYLTDEQSDELSDNYVKARDLRNIRLILIQAGQLTQTGRDVLANLLQNHIPMTQSRDIYERMANED